MAQPQYFAIVLPSVIGNSSDAPFEPGNRLNPRVKKNADCLHC